MPAAPIDFKPCEAHGSISSGISESSSKSGKNCEIGKAESQRSYRNNGTYAKKSKRPKKEKKIQKRDLQDSSAEENT
jgi:hypothetical protein